MKNLTKENAELLEALLIISAKFNTNMINKNYETRHLQQLNVVNEPFHERVYFCFLYNYINLKIKVSRFHRMAVQLMVNKWTELEWESFSTKNLTETPKVKF